MSISETSVGRLSLGASLLTAALTCLACDPRPAHQNVPVASPAHSGLESEAPALRRPCGPEPGVEEPTSCLPPEMRGGLILADDHQRMRTFERCNAPLRDGQVVPRVASSSIFYVERAGVQPLAPNVFSTLQMRPAAWTKLAQWHGLSRIARSTCSDSTGAITVPCMKVAFYSPNLDVAAVASILAEGYSDIGDACLIVEVTNGIRRQRMQ